MRSRGRGHVQQRLWFGTVGASALILIGLLASGGGSAADDSSLPGAAGPDSLVLSYLNSPFGLYSPEASGEKASGVLHRLGLDWPLSPWNMRSGQGLMAARSPEARYFVLIGVGYGEFGPGGKCN